MNEFIELFAGKGLVTRVLRAAGHTCMAVDLDYDPNPKHKRASNINESAAFALTPHQSFSTCALDHIYVYLFVVSHYYLGPWKLVTAS